MWNFIQELPNNPVFILILIAVCGYVWFAVPRLMKTDWWNRHIESDFPSCYNPKCFDCNKSGKECRGCPYVDPNYRG